MGTKGPTVGKGRRLQVNGRDVQSAGKGVETLFHDIFQDTSSGDFGIQPKVGPEEEKGLIFRCHTYILERTPGFLGKVRKLGRPLSRAVDPNELLPAKDYFKLVGFMELLESMEYSSFAQPIEVSQLARESNKIHVLPPMERAAAKAQLNSNIHRLHKIRPGTSKALCEETRSMEKHSMAIVEKLKITATADDPMAPGHTTAMLISGTTSALKRRDPYFLSERYEIDCDCESLVELLRFVYKGDSYFFDIQPRTDAERDMLKEKMLRLCFASEKLSVDLLFRNILKWFGESCYQLVGERNFADAFFHLQHFELQCTEEHSRELLISTVTGDMLRPRDQFRTITRDFRWSSLPVEFVEGTLRYDGMPISSEIEVLNLIERWNANADKPLYHIIRLLGCFRPDEETREQFRQWLTSMGWLKPSGEVAENMEALKGIRQLLDGTASGKKRPRHNLVGREAEEAYAEAASHDTKPRPPPGELEAFFVQYRGSTPMSNGFSFSLGSQQRLVQQEPIRTPGIQRLRVVLSNPRLRLWDPNHEVFVGISYGTGRYFGYLFGATAFSGIFSVRALASGAPAPNAPAHLTGSGNKVEFDIAIEVQLMRVNQVVTCKLTMISRNETLTEELFQVSINTLRQGDGLRYQVVGTGLEDQEVDVQLGWVSGGDVFLDQNDKAAGVESAIAASDIFGPECG